MSKVVLIAGGTGLIGSEITKALISHGFVVRILSRSKSKNSFQWKPDINDPFIEEGAFNDVYAVINTTGTSIIGGRWSKARKKILRSSRVETVQILSDHIIQNRIQIEHYIQISAVGYYGNRGSEILTERSAAGNTYMSQLTEEWEQSTSPLSTVTNVHILRCGLYLSENGGFYPLVSRLSQWYLASSFGKGNQMVSYSHKDEFNDLVLDILNNKCKGGVYNAVGAQTASLNEMISTIAQHVGRGRYLPNVPAFLLKLVLGEMSDTLLHSTNVISAREEVKRNHRFSDLRQALNGLGPSQLK